MLSRTLALLLALTASAGTVRGAELIERVVAVVDGRALFLSDVRAVEALDGVDRGTALARLVDETVLFQEAFRLPQAAADGPADAAPTPSRDDDAQLDPARQRARHRRAVIERYVAFRFRPQVRIDDVAVRRAYSEEVGAEVDEDGLEAAAPRIRARLIAVEVERRVAEWVRDLRAAANVRYNPPD